MPDPWIHAEEWGCCYSSDERRLYAFQVTRNGDALDHCRRHWVIQETFVSTGFSLKHETRSDYGWSLELDESLVDLEMRWWHV